MAQLILRFHPRTLKKHEGMKHRKRVLSDHKLIGKKLKPPIFQAFKDWETNFQETSYLDYVLSEIIWQAILNNAYGLTIASNITLKFLKEIQNHKPANNLRLFSLISNYETLTKEQLDLILNALKDDNEFKICFSSEMGFCIKKPKRRETSFLFSLF